ncbi:hypothetical protein [Paracoccus sp. (in: a-proteobacteria)]|uniref:hypothetical protein n=1 Tax=Paracoccus sp. TaxID=267 RepID=UPI0028989C41|nr:hypothetical protein [Paracoccus sp. (in: a-proteobacteria)]
MAEAQTASPSIREMISSLLGELGSSTGKAARRIGIPVPGGSASADAAQRGLAGVPNSTLGSDVVRCPIAIVLSVQSHAGDIALQGVTVWGNGSRIGTSDREGRVAGTVTASEGRVRIKAVYENPDRRVKREEFTLEITDINPTSRQARGGEARNFIAKVQDVFGSGEGGFPGDKDFIDRYAGADLVSMPLGGVPTLQVSVKMATLSLSVPYRNQNDAPETMGGVSFSGSVLCMPSSAEMQARYWQIPAILTARDGSQSQQAMDRRNVMQKCYDRAPKSFSLTGNSARHWQDWTNLRGAMGELAQAATPDRFRITTGPAGGEEQNIPSAYADGLGALLTKGLPVVTSTHATTFGHVMVVIGAVWRHDQHCEWLIMNDPNGTLASADSIYGTLRLQGTVGLNGANAAPDVRAVQEALIRTGHYQGEPGAPVTASDPNDPTIAAIRAFQGKSGDGLITPRGTTEARLNTRLGQGTSPGYSRIENETNRANDDRGRHVYYNGETMGRRQNTFKLKGQAWTCVIEPITPLTKAEIAARLTPGIPARPDPVAPAGA